MPAFRWEDIDQSLAGLRLLDLSIEMNRLIKGDKDRIHFEQRGNLNGNTVPSMVLQMQQDRADEWAQKVYEIYCDVWHKQGNAKSAAFLRAVFTRAIHPILRARAGSIASEFASFSVRTAFPTDLQQAHLRSLNLNMQRMEDRWRRRIEIEAKECEHADRIASAHLETLATRQTSQKGNPSMSVPELDQQPAPGSGQTIRGSLSIKPLMLKYRSGLKRAILGVLTRNPDATDAEVCRVLDADGGEELPARWRGRKEDRLFFQAYANPTTKRKVEIAISKIRRDLRDRGLLE